MNSFTRSCLVGAKVILSGLLSITGLPSSAETLTSVFSGNIALDGDISDFFDSNGVPKPGVCLKNDAAPEIPGVPGSQGLGEDPLAPTNSSDGFFHPSGFNQRRIVSAYNPTLNGGTIFVGIDLPGGNNSVANPNYQDSLVPVRVGPDGLLAIRPFDADGNGEAETIGRKVPEGTVLRRCRDADADDISDVVRCHISSTANLTDTPIEPGVTESYAVTVIFGDGTLVTVAAIEDISSTVGNARMVMTEGTTFGGAISTASGGLGNSPPLGFDVEFRITNINANIDEYSRVRQTILADSGSNRDGNGNGEDYNGLSCFYDVLYIISPAIHPSPTTPGALDFTFNLPTSTNEEYEIEASDDLTGNVWTSVKRIIGDGGVKAFLEQIKSDGARFFRVKRADNRPLQGEASENPPRREKPAIKSAPNGLNDH